MADVSVCCPCCGCVVRASAVRDTCRLRARVARLEEALRGLLRAADGRAWLSPAVDSACAILDEGGPEPEAPPSPPCAHDWVFLQTIPGSGLRCRLCGLTDSY